MTSKTVFTSFMVVPLSMSIIHLCTISSVSWLLQFKVESTTNLCIFYFQSVTVSILLVFALSFPREIERMSSGLDILSGSLRVRNGTFKGSRNVNSVKHCRSDEVKACPSVMSPETKRLLPPNTETVQTKPFPIRGKLIESGVTLLTKFQLSLLY